MKRMLIFFVLIIFFIGISYDLKYGTLEASTIKQENVNPVVETENDIDQFNYLKVNVKAGETVLSIVEKLHDGNIPVSITQVVKDFETLNKGIDAHTIQQNKSYLFPIYN